VIKKIRKWLANRLLPTAVQEHQTILIGNIVYVFGKSSTRFANAMLKHLHELGYWRKDVGMSIRQLSCSPEMSYPTIVPLGKVVWALAIQKMVGAKNENLACPRCHGTKYVMQGWGYLQLPVACPLCTSDDDK
jgi:hypothetical protein